MKRPALAAMGAFAGIGAIAFVIVQLASVDGNGVAVGVPEAAADCVEASPNCLPKIPMTDDTGAAWNASTLSGKIVILNVWATWCQPCQKEIPALSHFYESHKDEVVMLGLLSEYGVTKDQLDGFRQEYNMTYPVVFMEPEVREALGNPSGLPTTFFYDRGGKLSYLHTGELTEAQLEEQTARLLR